MKRFMLVCLDSNSQIELTNADIHNVVWGLKHAHASAHGVDTEYERLRTRIAETFKEDVQ